MAESEKKEQARMKREKRREKKEKEQKEAREKEFLREQEAYREEHRILEARFVSPFLSPLSTYLPVSLLFRWDLFPVGSTSLNVHEYMNNKFIYSILFHVFHTKDKHQYFIQVLRYLLV